MTREKNRSKKSKLVEAGSGERPELVELGRSDGAVESRGSKANPECPSTRTKDEDEHDGSGD